MRKVAWNGLRCLRTIAVGGCKFAPTGKTRAILLSRSPPAGGLDDGDGKRLPGPAVRSADPPLCNFHFTIFNLQFPIWPTRPAAPTWTRWPGYAQPNCQRTSRRPRSPCSCPVPYSLSPVPCPDYSPPLTAAAHGVPSRGARCLLHARPPRLFSFNVHAIPVLCMAAKIPSPQWRPAPMATGPLIG